MYQSLRSYPCHVVTTCCEWKLGHTPPFQRWMFGPSLAHAYDEINQHGLFPFHRQASLRAEISVDW